MRTLVIVLAGLVLWAVFLGIARLNSPVFGGKAFAIATIAFVITWFVVAAVNLWIGVSRAGYSLQEELPIFLLIFLLPAGIAIFVKWKFL
ncbi:MAG: hypothetical protein WD051_13980 [Steroidobacteraceae bacterium]